MVFGEILPVKIVLTNRKKRILEHHDKTEINVG